MNQLFSNTKFSLGVFEDLQAREPYKDRLLFFFSLQLIKLYSLYRCIVFEVQEQFKCVKIHEDCWLSFETLNLVQAKRTKMLIECFLHINECEVRLSIFTQLNKRLPSKYHYHIVSIKQVPKLALRSSVQRQRILAKSLHNCTA